MVKKPSHATVPLKGASRELDLSICYLLNYNGKIYRDESTSTQVNRVPQCNSFHRKWDSPPPAPPPAGAPPPPLRNQRGEHTRLRVKEWGVPIPTTGEKAYHSAYSVDESISSLWATEKVLSSPLEKVARSPLRVCFGFALRFGTGERG